MIVSLLDNERDFV